jgi:hypothetical protein
MAMIMINAIMAMSMYTTEIMSDTVPWLYDQELRDDYYCGQIPGIISCVFSYGVKRREVISIGLGLASLFVTAQP